jgi:hypothetical protein
MKRFFVILLLQFISEAQVKTQSVVHQADSTLVVHTLQFAEQRSPIEEIFQKIEHGLQTNSVDEFENELSAMVSITIISGERGYYSVHQAVSVLSGYFSERRLISFEFTRIYDKDSTPYATGRFVYVHKGVQETAQVYVSLTQQAARWVISQFNIY